MLIGGYPAFISSKFTSSLPVRALPSIKRMETLPSSNAQVFVRFIHFLDDYSSIWTKQAIYPGHKLEFTDLQMKSCFRLHKQDWFSRNGALINTIPYIKGEIRDLSQFSFV